MDLSVSMTLASLGMAISTGLRMGPLACSSRVGARPSQNCTVWPPALYTVGELRPPSCFLWPGEKGLPSTPYLFRSWQLLQETSWFFERRFSKYSMRPSSTFSGVMGFFGSSKRAGSALNTLSMARSMTAFWVAVAGVAGAAGLAACAKTGVTAVAAIRNRGRTRVLSRMESALSLCFTAGARCGPG